MSDSEHMQPWCARGCRTAKVPSSGAVFFRSLISSISSCSLSQWIMMFLMRESQNKRPHTLHIKACEDFHSSPDYACLNETSYIAGIALFLEINIACCAWEEKWIPLFKCSTYDVKWFHLQGHSRLHGPRVLKTRSRVLQQPLDVTVHCLFMLPKDSCVSIFNTIWLLEMSESAVILFQTVQLCTYREAPVSVVPIWIPDDYLRIFINIWQVSQILFFCCVFTKGWLMCVSSTLSGDGQFRLLRLEWDSGALTPGCAAGVFTMGPAVFFQASDWSSLGGGNTSGLVSFFACHVAFRTL